MSNHLSNNQIINQITDSGSLAPAARGSLSRLAGAAADARRQAAQSRRRRPGLTRRRLPDAWPQPPDAFKFNLNASGGCQARLKLAGRGPAPAPAGALSRVRRRPGCRQLHPTPRPGGRTAAARIECITAIVSSYQHSAAGSQAELSHSGLESVRLQRKAIRLQRKASRTDSRPL